MHEHELGPVAQRFLNYVLVPSQSNEDLKDKTKPTTPGQMIMLRMLRTDLLAMGADPRWINLNEHGVLTLEVPASPGRENEPHRTYGAHVDTYPNGAADVRPKVHFFDGEDLVLPRGNTVIKAADIMHLKGKHIITSSGDSVLGADDKAGVAAIMHALERIFTFKMTHGPFLVVFFTDEELGGFMEPEDIPESMKTTSCFLTVDGSSLGEIDDGCFSGREVKAIYRHPDDFPTGELYASEPFIVTFKGKDAHPGGNGKAIVPSHYAACDFIRRVRLDGGTYLGNDIPFFHVTSIDASPSESTVTCVYLDSDDPTVDSNVAASFSQLMSGTLNEFTDVDATSRQDKTEARKEKFEPKFAIYAAAELVATMADWPTPWEPALDRSFQYAHRIKGDERECTVTCIPRAYLDTRSIELVDGLTAAAGNVLNDLCACDLCACLTCETGVKHSYTSTKDAIDAHREVLDPIVAAHKKRGIEVTFNQAPGGTDGAMFNLHFPVPSPNIGPGGQRFHQLDEHIAADDLEAIGDIMILIMTA